MANPKFQGPAARAVDNWFRTGNVQSNLTDARNYLAAGLPFNAIIGQLQAAGRSRPEFVYPLGGGANQGPDFERVMRQGYLQAIGLAFGHSPPVPISHFWMTGAGNNKFEVHISDEAQQVSLTVLVPGVEGGSEDEGDPESWVVRIDDDDEVETRQTSGPPAQEPPSARGDTAAD